VVNLGDREFWSKRKRREGTYQARTQCQACGYLLGMRSVPNGKSRWYGASAFPRLCDGCSKKKR